MTVSWERKKTINMASLQDLKDKYADAEAFIKARKEEMDVLSTELRLLKKQVKLETMFETTEKDVLIITPIHNDFITNEKWSHEENWIDSGWFKDQTKKSDSWTATWEHEGVKDDSPGVKYYWPYMTELSWVVNAAYNPFPPSQPLPHEYDYSPHEYTSAKHIGIKQGAKEIFRFGYWGHPVDDWVVIRGRFKAMIHRYRSE